MSYISTIKLFFVSVIFFRNSEILANSFIKTNSSSSLASSLPPQSDPYSFGNYKNAAVSNHNINLQVVTSPVIFSTASTSTQWTVPADWYVIKVSLYGSEGDTGSNTGAGGKGGFLQVLLTVTPGTVLTIYVGGRSGNLDGGAPGSGEEGYGTAGYGGDSSHIKVSTSTNWIATAGGGGGGGYAY